MIGEYVLSDAHNSSLTPEFTTSFCPSYFVAQKASVASKVFATRQVIQTDAFAYNSNPITKARGSRAIMPQEKRTLLTKGEETTTPQATRASNFRVP
jgi:hypothetical protein